MKKIVFYSWQSDLPNPTNRGFIQEALESAASSIALDASIAIEPVVDRDTQGVPGSPDISSTIFSKITAADAFVADVSIVARLDKRPAPNPNVLIELGYALKALGHEKVILVFNRAFGKIEELPFDLRTRRVLSYEMAVETTPRAPERKSLEKQLDGAIRAALTAPYSMRESVTILAVSAIESQAPNRVIILRRNLASILKALNSLKPKTTSEGGTLDDLIGGLRQTQETIAEFCKIAEIIASMADAEAAVEVVRWFGKIFDHYRLPPNHSGQFYTSDFDYFKFLGHEMLVTLVAFLLREHQLSIIEMVLDEPISATYVSRSDGPGSVGWAFASDHLPSLIDESPRRKRVSIHADLLNERHAAGGLSEILPIEEFVAADYLLYLLGEIRQSDQSGWGFAWRPWSALYLNSTPSFLVNAERKRIAEQMQKIFQVNDLEELKRGILEANSNLGKLFNRGFWLNPIQADVVRRIGSR